MPEPRESGLLVACERIRRSLHSTNYATKANVSLVPKANTNRTSSTFAAVPEAKAQLLTTTKNASLTFPKVFRPYHCRNCFPSEQARLVRTSSTAIKRQSRFIFRSFFGNLTDRSSSQAKKNHPQRDLQYRSTLFALPDRLPCIEPDSEVLATHSDMRIRVPFKNLLRNQKPCENPHRSIGY